MRKNDIDPLEYHAMFYYEIQICFEITQNNLSYGEWIFK